MEYFEFGRNLLNHFEWYEKGTNLSSKYNDNEEISALTNANNINYGFEEYLGGTRDNELQQNIQLRIDLLASPDEVPKTWKTKIRQMKFILLQRDSKK